MNRSKTVAALLLFGMAAVPSLHAQETRTDTIATVATEGSNRNMLMNAASASQPRQISLGLPLATNAYIYEDGLPVSYYPFPLYPFKSWHGGVQHEYVGTMSPGDMALKYGVISYSVDSRSRIDNDTFGGKVNYTVNMYGRQAVDATVASPMGKGWGFNLSTYQNFDPGSNHLDMSYLKERQQTYKLGISKKWDDGRGRAGLMYQYSRFTNIDEKYGPFVFTGDGSVEAYGGFSLGHDQYLPANNTVEYMDVVTGEMKTKNINKANTDRIHNVNFVMQYTWDSGLKFYLNSKFKRGVSNRANSTVTTVDNAGAGSGYTYEDNTPYTGKVQTRRILVFDGAPETSWMTNAGLNGTSRDRRHSWSVEADYWYNRSEYICSMLMFAHEAKKNPKMLLLNGKRGYNYNTYAEYAKGREHKLFAWAGDEWTVNSRLWLKAGLRLEYLNVSGTAANEDGGEGNRRHAGFYVNSPEVSLTDYNDNYFNRAFILGGRYGLTRGFGVQAEFTSATIHSQTFHYSGYTYPSTKAQTADYLRAGIYWKNSWIDLTSQFTYITMNNSQLRPQLSHVLTRDVGELRAGQSETITPTLYYGQKAPGWTTDAVFTPFKGFSLHALLTVRDPQYKDFDLTTTFSDGVTESHNFNGNTITALSKTEIEIEPSYTFGDWRVWLSARYFSKQYINKTNTLYFNGRWETFGGVDYTLNKTVSFSANVINILNQSGANGSISSADLVTDTTGYQNYLMSGTFIRPFTVEFTTKISF